MALYKFTYLLTYLLASFKCDLETHYGTLPRRNTHHLATAPQLWFNFFKLWGVSNLLYITLYYTTTHCR